MKRFISNFLLLSVLLVGISSCKKDPVVVKATGISLDQKTAVVRIGTPLKLTASIAPFDATDKSVTWTTKDASIAGVAADGTVSGVATGSTEITVTANDGSFTDKCAVTIFPSAGSTISLTGNITSNVTLKSDINYILDGWVYVKSGATITIEPGTVIKGKTDTKASLVIERGAKIMAIGTVAKPIIFTSAKPAGSRAAGDWGGIVLCGNAKINVTGGEAEIEGGLGTKYGGTDDNDNSGTLQYVRIEFAGYAFQPDKEINGLTLGAVGRGTTIDYVQVSFANDDSFEWFGGTVNCKHLIAFSGLDDEFDTDFGFSGYVQYAVGLRDPMIADISKSNGFESDNDGSGSTNIPTTNPRFANVSLFGPLATVNTTINPLFQAAMHIRRKSNLEVYNSLFAGWPKGLLLADPKGNGGSGAQVKGCILSGMTANFSGNTAGEQAFFEDVTRLNRTVALNTDLKVTTPFNLTAPNFLPQTGSPLLTGAATLPTGLEATDYIGAFKTTDWTAGWTNWNPKTTVY
ncbi:MAG: Ig-like domain-containing protein [Prolixibacteraceae bacterium]|jgi:hypothetical protein|nr:Ig-like domain-containing protein [Prolixibacteraceae bacterium]